MKNSVAILALWASSCCHAWVPSGIRTSRTSLNHLQRRTTPVYATIDKESEALSDSVSDAFNKDDDDDQAELKKLFSPIPYSELTIGVVKETFQGENRVSQTPDSVKGLINAGFTVVVQSGGKIVNICFEN